MTRGHPTLALAFGLGLLACGSPTGPSSPSSAGDLAARLRRAGASVEARGAVSHFFFSVESAAFAVDDPVTRLHVFEYATREQAEAEAALVQPDGRTIAGRTGGPALIHICWIATPHFYLSGRLIVLYTGDDARVTALLADLLGRPFAGGSPNPPGDICR
jgi:hypothetical protein